MKKIKSPSGWWSGKNVTRAFQVVGSCLLLSLAGNSLAFAADGVEVFAVAKFDNYFQSSAQAPQLVQNPYRIDLTVEGTSPTSVSAVKVTRPGGSVFALEKNHPDDSAWKKNYEFSTRGARDTGFPNGNYTFTITTASDGDQAVTLNLAGGAFPAAPRVSNYAAAQEIDLTSPFVLKWDAFANAGPDGFIMIGIEDVSDDFREVYGSGFLPTTTTSLEITSEMLQPGREYEVFIIFAKVADKNETAFAGGTGLAVYGSETLLQIQTVSDLGPGVGVDEYVVAKLKHYTQDSALSPQEVSLENELFIKATGPDTVLSGAVMFPDEEMRSMEKEESLGSSWRVPVDSNGGWDGFLSNGTYRFHIETADGMRVVPLQFTEGNYPAAARVSNYVATQEIDSEAPFVLEWDAFVGASPNDFVMIGIEDASSDYEEVYKSGFLPAATSSLTLPAGMLQVGRAYDVWINFVKVVDKNETAFESGIGLAAYVSETQLQIRTRGGYELWSEPLPPGERGEMDDPGGHGIVNLLRYAFGMNPLQPTLADLPQVGTLTPAWLDGKARLSLRYFERRDAGYLNYVVEYSGDLVVWKKLNMYETITAPEGGRYSVTVIDPVRIEDQGSRFLRVRVVR